MAFRQIKAPALANAAITPTKVAPSAVSGQDAALVVNSLINDTLLLHVSTSDTLARITVRHLVDSLDTNDLAEGAANLYFTIQRAKDAVASDIAAAVAAEALIARAAESANATSVTNEVARATAAEGVNAAAITAETNRATGAESTIVSAYEAADTSLQTQISNILNNTDEVSLNSLAEIVAAFETADDAFTASVSANATAIALETTNRIAADGVINVNNTNTQAELDATQVGAGLSAAGAYVVGASTNYLSTATSLNDADVKLDVQMKTNADDITALQASVSGLSGSSAADIQANADAIDVVEADLAAEIVTARAAEGALSNSLQGEITARDNADTLIRTDFAAADTAQTTALQTYADTAEADAIATAALDATSKADTAEADAIASAEAKDVARAVTSDAADTLLAGRATTLETEMDTAEGRLDDIEAQSGSATLGTVAQTLSGAINELHTDTNAVEARVTTNETDIATNATAIGNLLTNTDAVALNSLAELVVAYEAADSTIGGLITANGTAISDEAATRLANDNTLQANITAEAATARAAEVVNANAIAAEAGTRAAADVTLQDNIDAIATGATGDTDAIQIELDATQTGAGLGIDGTYTAHATGDYISAATSLKDADIKLDVQMKANADAIVAEATRAGLAEVANTNAITANDTDIATNVTNIAQEIVDRGIADTDLGTRIDDVQSELDASQVGAGLSALGAYVQSTSANYIAAATSLSDADAKLDTALKTEADRAALAEGVNDGAITAEVSRATAAEGVNAAAVVTERDRAVAAELVLTGNVTSVTNDLAQELLDRNSADVALGGRIDFITSNTDAVALDSLSELLSAFQSADSGLSGLITANADDITAEAIRAGLAEVANADAIVAEALLARAAELSNANAISSEETRALTAEGVLQSDIDTKVAKSGSTMSGVLNMGSNVITGLATPSATTDAASKSYVDGLISSSDISTTNTDSLTEGTTNLYFTDARAQGAISVVDTEGTGRVSYANGVVTVDTQKSFLELSDFEGTETDYSATANYIAVVNPAGTGMVLVDPTGLLVSDVQRQTLNGDDVTTTFAVTFEIGTAEDVMVFVGGVIQDPSSHYTVNSVAQTITFTAGAIPTGTQAVLVGHQTGYTVQAGAVTSEKLAADVKPFIQSGNVSATTGGDIVDTFDGSIYRSAKYVIQVSDSVSGEYEVREALVVHDGSAAYITEFGMVYTGAALIGDASVSMSAGTVQLTYTTASVTATVKVISTYINV